MALLAGWASTSGERGLTGRRVWLALAWFLGLLLLVTDLVVVVVVMMMIMYVRVRNLADDGASGRRRRRGVCVGRSGDGGEMAAAGGCGRPVVVVGLLFSGTLERFMLLTFPIGLLLHLPFMLELDGQILLLGPATLPTALPVTHQELETKGVYAHTRLKANTQVAVVHLVLVDVRVQQAEMARYGKEKVVVEWRQLRQLVPQQLWRRGRARTLVRNQCLRVLG